MRLYYFVCCFLVFLGLSGSVLGQTDTSASLTRTFDRYVQATPQEKLLLHIDRPCYASGETMWFKLYAADGTTHRPLAVSRVAYVELLDSEQKPVLQTKVALRAATGHGSLVLPQTVPSGSYTLRAYTNWMKNFAPDFYFQAQVTVVNTFVRPAGEKARSAVRYAAQFLPEGGNLVKGLSSKVAFSITNSHGQGVAAEGIVSDNTGRVITRFKTLKFGLGSFMLTPQQAGDAYTATIVLPDKQTLRQKLPSVYAQGYVMHVEEAEATKLTISLQTTNTSPERVFLLAQTRHKLTFSTTLPLSGGQATISLDRKTLPDGITHFTFFDARQRPLCERLYCQLPQQPLAITATPPGQAAYGTRTKVVLPIATQHAASPVPAHVSVAVYRLDSLSATPAPSISSTLWLTSDLKGTVENPDYYLSSPDQAHREALDNLMLTHGWSRFRWSEVLAGQLPTLSSLPEVNGHLIQGRVLNRATGKPAPGVVAYLAAPSRHVQLYTSTSQEDGSIQFETRSFYGQRNLVAQTNVGRDSMYQVELAAPFSAKYPSAPALPSVALAESWRTALTERHRQVQVQAAYFGQQNNRYAPTTGDSLAFYGAADETYLLDKYTRFKVMEEVMREYVTGVQVRNRRDGFHLAVINKPYRTLFTENPLVLVDGVPIFNINKVMTLDPLQVRKLEVVTSNYFQGPLIYNGIVSYTTYKSDLGGFAPDSHALIQEYEGLQQEREFYSPRYETAQQQQSRLPDLRNLLYWNPTVETSATGRQQVEFYTSDQVGRYRVVVQGLTPDGVPGYTSFTLDVKPTL